MNRGAGWQCRAVPLHVGEPVAESEHLQDGGTEGPAVLEVRCIQLAQRDLDGTDPFMQLGEKRAREVPADVLEQHPPVRADGVVSELLGINEFLDTDPRYMSEHRQDGIELVG